MIMEPIQNEQFQALLTPPEMLNFLSTVSLSLCKDMSNQII